MTSRSHRMHHEDPHHLDMILLGPLEATALLVLVPIVASVFFLLPLGLHATMTAWVMGYALVGIYEWTHFLIHTAHRPRSRYYRSIWRGHRLHHFKNERYWHGITNTVSDRVLGTQSGSALGSALRDGAHAGFLIGVTSAIADVR